MMICLFDHVLFSTGVIHPMQAASTWHRQILEICNSDIPDVFDHERFSCKEVVSSLSARVAMPLEVALFKIKCTLEV